MVVANHGQEVWCLQAGMCRPSLGRLTVGTTTPSITNTHRERVYWIPYPSQQWGFFILHATAKQALFWGAVPTLPTGTQEEAERVARREERRISLAAASPPQRVNHYSSSAQHHFFPSAQIIKKHLCSFHSITHVSEKAALLSLDYFLWPRFSWQNNNDSLCQGLGGGREKLSTLC